MRYNELTKEDLQNIRDVYKDSSLTSQQAIDELSENFDVSTRTIRNWLDLMRLSGVKKPKNKKWNMLVIPDLHFPFVHKDALEFCKEAYSKHDIDEVVFLGDIIDNHYSSFHDQDPDGMAAGDEIRLAKQQLVDWKTAFPTAKVMIGNHDAIPSRKAFAAGLSKKWIRGIDEVFDLKGWDFVQNYTIGRNFFTHGLGMNVLARARALGLNVFQGHLHSKFSCTCVSVHPEFTFAVQCGCLIDHKAYAFAYGKDGLPSVMGCVVIEDALNNPEIIMKPLYD